MIREEVTNQKIVEDVLLYLINEQNKKSWISGGMALPQFKTYADYLEFVKVMEQVFPATKEPFKNHSDAGEIVFDLPPRFRHD